MFEITKNKQEILISVISNVCPQNANVAQSAAGSSVTGNPKNGFFVIFGFPRHK